METQKVLSNVCISVIDILSLIFTFLMCVNTKYTKCMWNNFLRCVVMSSTKEKISFKWLKFCRILKKRKNYLIQSHFFKSLTPMQFLSVFFIKQITAKISFRSRLSIAKTGNSFGGRSINGNMGMKTVKKWDQPQERMISIHLPLSKVE